MKVAVLTCGTLGIEVANRLHELRDVEVVGLVSAPYSRGKSGFRQRLRRLYRAHGLRGLVAHMARKAVRRIGWQEDPAPRALVLLNPSIPRFDFGDFHNEACITTLRQLQPDLGVVAGTYILQEEVFSLPRLGSINLHSGKAPEYRGSAPVFWELYNGEPCVGITIHRVSSSLDAGNILLQELFPLDSAPNEDPLRYIERYRLEVLHPHGIRMLTDAVRQISDGSISEHLQDHSNARTYRNPDFRAVRELRRRVRDRKKGRQAP